MDAVTIGPMPSWSTDPWAPARIERNCPKMSWALPPRPNIVTFVRKKYSTRTPAVQASLRRKGTWPSGRRTVGIRVSTGSAVRFQPIGSGLVARFPYLFAFLVGRRFCLGEEFLAALGQDDV